MTGVAARVVAGEEQGWRDVAAIVAQRHGHGLVGGGGGGQDALDHRLRQELPSHHHLLSGR